MVAADDEPRAEVVVPSADLISSAVTNWTLSDRLCRIEVPVSVASGPDPESVIALLLDAARSGQHLLEEPAPQVVFKGFGKGSLEVVSRPGPIRSTTRRRRSRASWASLSTAACARPGSL
jgi:small-conductance mechanosensitive channel